MGSDAVISLVIFAAVFLCIIFELADKTIVSMAGACLAVGLKLITFEQAIDAIDFNVLFLLIGMMISVSILSRTGFFEWTAILLAKKSGGRPVVILILFLLITAVFSSVLANVTTVMLLIPVTILVCQILEISPVPFVISEAIASNVGGTATLIGDPPNIIIGSQAGLTFNQFLWHLGPVVAVAMAVFILTVWLMFRKQMQVPASIRARVADALPELAITDRANMIKSLIVIGLMLAVFFLHSVIEVEVGIVALGAAMVQLFWCRDKVDSAFGDVEWGVIFFFIGLFVMISAVEHSGVLAAAAKWMIGVAGHNLFLLCVVILWGSAVLSAVVDNIPFVITMIPILKACIPSIASAMGVSDAGAIEASIAGPMWWSLALGACLGGSGTLIGASPNVVSVQICNRNNYPISFWQFTKYGIFFTVQQMLICTGYIWVRYFWLK